MELCSESNLFFHYMHEMDAAAFREMQVRVTSAESEQRFHKCLGTILPQYLSASASGAPRSPAILASAHL
jgi:hypothetical protein